MSKSEEVRSLIVRMLSLNSAFPGKLQNAEKMSHIHFPPVLYSSVTHETIRIFKRQFNCDCDVNRAVPRCPDVSAHGG